VAQKLGVHRAQNNRPNVAATPFAGDGRGSLRILGRKSDRGGGAEERSIGQRRTGSHTRTHIVRVVRIGTERSRAQATIAGYVACACSARWSTGAPGSGVGNEKGLFRSHG
jgi:hypothetical protein